MLEDAKKAMTFNAVANLKWACRCKICLHVHSHVQFNTLSHFVPLQGLAGLCSLFSNLAEVWFVQVEAQFACHHISPVGIEAAATERVATFTAILASHSRLVVSGEEARTIHIL